MAQDATQLAGRWRSVETSKGGIGAMYDFAADGTVRFSPGAIVAFQYHAEGERLSFFPPDAGPVTLAWSGDDRVRMSFLPGAGEEYTRLGARRDPNNKLTGEWTGTRDMQGQQVLVHWIFRADSSALMMIRFLTQEGAYSIQNGTLNATFNGRPGLVGTIEFNGGILSIHRSGGRVTKLTRY